MIDERYHEALNTQMYGFIETVPNHTVAPDEMQDAY